MTDFENELTKLINRHNMEGKSNTPDHLLAEYLVDCLYLFHRMVRLREIHYGREVGPSIYPEIKPFPSIMKEMDK